METFVCKKCAQDLPASAFSPRNNSLLGHETTCRQCRRERRLIRSKSIIPGSTRMCRKCGTEKSLSEFPKNKYKAGGVGSQCRTCRKSLDAEWRSYKVAQRCSPALATKECVDCKHDLELVNYRLGGGAFGRDTVCIKCRRIRGKKYYEKNKDHFLARGQKWRLENRDKHLACVRAWSKSERGSELIRKARTARRKNISVKLHTNIGNLIRYHLRTTNGMHTKRKKSFAHALPYTLLELRKHLESKFLPGMTWDNYGKWHVEHITPFCSTPYVSMDDPNFSRCWALTNLRPLWASDNSRKSANHDRYVSKLRK